MSTRMNWGGWIVVSFILFAVGTFVMVYISMSTRVDLVTDDYYEKELRYQEHIDLVKGSNALAQSVSMEMDAGMVRFSFPNLGDRTAYGGSIHFFRPSDKARDITVPVALDSSYGQSLPTAMLTGGLWRAKISWSVGQQQYYAEHPIIIQ
ncbi:MAG: FixH family protein [Bacteroidetes bacterium]|nr:FixH family protein [Bacteroidota bacterium]